MIKGKNSREDMERSLPAVYICSRYRPKSADPERQKMGLKQNIERAKQGSYFAALLGFSPLCPHLLMTQLLKDEVWWQRELGMKIGLEWLKLSSEVWIFGYEGLCSLSEGMRREVALAVAMDKPIRAFSEDYQLDLADKLEGTPVSQQKDKFYEKLEEALHVGDARQYLSFAGKSSKDFLLYLSGPGVYDSPAADVESTSVPGRNGDIITENARTGRRRYQNVDIKYKAFFFNGLPAKTAAVKAWLLSPIGYQKLQDTYDPDFFRMAVCKDALEFDVTAQKAAEMELTFNCKPQRWSVDGQKAIRLDSRSTLKNPFAFPAQPIFKVYGDSGGELYVGEEKITIHSIKDYVLLNCETHNAYNASGFCNETIFSDDFPELPEGKTQITWTGGITAVEVTPRWWTL